MRSPGKPIQCEGELSAKSEGGFCHVKEEVFRRAHRWDLKAGRGRSAGCGVDSQSGIAEQTYYCWKKQYVGLEVDQVRHLEQVQEENARLKQLVAELSLDKPCSRRCSQKSSKAVTARTGRRVSVRPVPGQ